MQSVRFEGIMCLKLMNILTKQTTGNSQIIDACG